MAQPYVGEIRMFGGNFPPAGWAFCDGQLMPISENETLFQLIGTTYGGDGQETFALPNLASRVPVHMGTGPGLSTYVIGQMSGVEQVTLTSNQIPSHNHPLVATTQGGVNLPTGAMLGTVNGGPAGTNVYGSDAPLQPLAAQAVTAAGGSQPHDNMAPFLAISFIISLFGIFPSQN